MNAAQVMPYLPLVFAVVIVAVSVAGERSLLGDERNMFAHAIADASPHAQARIVAAIERRRRAERFAPMPLLIGIVTLFAIGLASAFGFMDPKVAFAASMMVYTVAAFAQIVTARRSDRGRRAAALQNRKLAQLVPLWLMCIPLFSSVTGIAVMRAYGFSFPEFLAVVTPLVGLVALPLVVRTPAIVGAEDPSTDELVDEKVRGSRLRQMLLITAYAPLFVMFTVVPLHTDGASMVRTTWMLAITALVLWSNRRLRFSQDDLRRMYGL